jgi:hypothetical protein
VQSEKLLTEEALNEIHCKENERSKGSDGFKHTVRLLHNARDVSVSLDGSVKSLEEIDYLTESPAPVAQIYEKLN